MADVDLKLSERADSAATCVFCREALDAAPVSCPGCGVGLHAACRDEVSRCPTLGCGQTWERRPGAAAAARTQATPLAGFTPIVRGAAGRAEHGLELSGESSKLKLLVLLLLPLAVGAFLIIRSAAGDGADLRLRAEERAAQVADETRRAHDPELNTRAQREEALRAAADEITARPLMVAGDEASTWRAGSLEPFGRAKDARAPGVLLLELLSTTGGANGLTLEDARGLMAGLRQRALAALPPAAADAWAQHAPGSSADARLVLDRLEHGVRDGRPFEGSTRAALDVRFVLQAVRPDAVDLRVTAKHAYASVSWTETWPRAVEPALRTSVLTLSDHPAARVVLQRVSRQVRAVTAEADGVRVQVFQQDGLPLPWHAALQRDVDGQRSHRVELELLEWRPAS